QAKQRLQEYLGYAKAGKFPDDAFSMLSQTTRDYWTPNKVRNMIRNWREPRSFEDLENLYKELLQNEGKFRKETRRSFLSGKQKKLTDKEVKFLYGMTLFTIEDKKKHTTYNTSIKGMSQKTYDNRRKSRKDSPDRTEEQAQSHLTEQAEQRLQE